jgi:hypothetical protein
MQGPMRSNYPETCRQQDVSVAALYVDIRPGRRAAEERIMGGHEAEELPFAKKTAAIKLA